MFFKHSTLLLCALAVFVGPMMFDSVSAADVASPARFDSSSATSITTTSLEGAYTAQEFDLSKIEALHVVPSGNGTVSVDYEGMGLDGDDHQHRLQRRYHYRAGAAPTWHKWMR